jgi:large subunit ribosomal protein L29
VKAKELRTLTREELEQRLREAREELFNLKFQHKTGQLGNPLRIREVRKDIARLVTVLKEGGTAGSTARSEGSTEAGQAE